MCGYSGSLKHGTIHAFVNNPTSKVLNTIEAVNNRMQLAFYSKVSSQTNYIFLIQTGKTTI